jgi:hypothetical protein
MIRNEINELTTHTHCQALHFFIAINASLERAPNRIPLTIGIRINPTFAKRPHVVR